MNLLPYENLTFRTKLKEDEIIKRLIKLTEPKRALRFGIFTKSSTKLYEGEIYAKHFHITRIIRYRNSFLPEINGVIQANIYETQINIKMRLSNFAIVFMSFWCLITMLISIIALISAIKYDLAKTGVLIPLGMLIFGYLLTMAGFKSESSKSIEDMLKLFEGEIIK